MSKGLLATAKFQSTLPVRGATGDTIKRVLVGVDFNPRSP